MTTRVVGVRLPLEDHRWVADLARRNEVTVAAMIRALLHGVHIMAAEGRIDALSMGELQFRPPAGVR
jgi:hypothetical protein